MASLCRRLRAGSGITEAFTNERHPGDHAFESLAMIAAFRRHPQDCGETYRQHLAAALGCGAAMTLGGLACLVHAIFPFWFTNAASGRIQRLYERMSVRGRLAARAEPEGHHSGSGI